MDILNGDMNLDDDQTPELFKRNPRDRRQLKELREIVRRLDDAARLERDVLAEIEGIEGAPGEADVERVVARARAQPSRSDQQT